MTASTIGGINKLTEHEKRDIYSRYIPQELLQRFNLSNLPENKELFDGYVLRLEELNTEYNSLSKELTDNGPDEHTVNALIQNLKFRLNLMYRLKEQLNQLNTIESSQG